MSNYTKKLFLVDESKFNQLKNLQSSSGNESALKQFNQKFMEDKQLALADLDNSWAKLANRVQPILQSSLSAVPSVVPQIANSAPTNPPLNSPATVPSTTTTGATVDGGPPAGAIGGDESLEAAVGKLGAHVRTKALKLLNYLQTLPGVNINGNRLNYSGKSGDGLAIIEDLVRPRQKLTFVDRDLLKIIAKGPPIGQVLISNWEARQLINALKGEVLSSDLPPLTPSPKFETLPAIDSQPRKVSVIPLSEKNSLLPQLTSKKDPTSDAVSKRLSFESAESPKPSPPKILASKALSPSSLIGFSPQPQKRGPVLHSPVIPQKGSVATPTFKKRQPVTHSPVPGQKGANSPQDVRSIVDGGGRVQRSGDKKGARSKYESFFFAA